MNKYLKETLNVLLAVTSVTLSVLNVVVGTLLKPVVWVARFLNFLHKKWNGYQLYRFEKKVDEVVNEAIANKG